MHDIQSSNNDGQTYKAHDFSKRSLENKLFTSCSFNSCNFTEAILRNAKFCACAFVNCNISLTKLDACRFQDVQFNDCKIVGADFFRCDKTIFSVSFKQCLLQYCNFSDLQMKNTKFKGSKLNECHFTHTLLTHADFSDTDLSGTIFHQCDLTHADFSTAARYSIDPQTNKIKKAKFSLPEVLGLLRGFDITIT